MQLRAQRNRTTALDPIDNLASHELLPSNLHVSMRLSESQFSLSRHQLPQRMQLQSRNGYQLSRAKYQLEFLEKPNGPPIMHTYHSPRRGHKTWSSLLEPACTRSMSKPTRPAPRATIICETHQHTAMGARSHAPVSHVKLCLSRPPFFPTAHLQLQHNPPNQPTTIQLTAGASSGSSSDQLIYLEFGCSGAEVVPSLNAGRGFGGASLPLSSNR